MDQCYLVRLSITALGIHLLDGDDAMARKLANRSIEYGAGIRGKGRRNSVMTCLPLPDVDGSLAELGYALDHLKAETALLCSIPIFLTNISVTLFRTSQGHSHDFILAIKNLHLIVLMYISYTIREACSIHASWSS